MIPKTAVVLAALPLLIACKSTHDFPPRTDLQAVTEAKPIPPTTILTDPTASDQYNIQIEAWGERVRAAGMRLCQYFKAQGMEVACPSE